MERSSDRIFWVWSCGYCDVLDVLRVGWQPKCEEHPLNGSRVVSILERDVGQHPQLGYRGDVLKWASLRSRAEHPSRRMAANERRLVAVEPVETGIV